ncbi:hypothetical protein MCOR27_009572 [Pyricularia oryzae]|nr:hypothetical protein MCOR27_009572 [Pyricularia oryzae]KAI6332760.1 hypothetical protein MCOR29_001285 [Pyricularia oryzae]KAI6408496.1 hypothetical protein MCOR23_001391 [Pyricularia oryzae]KAI6416391.1 hypothetical protein MCOR20_001064 [Pyricularia oryzae]KAI6423142.1 hypothetical protein MCOR24_003849 [Pyricularia oryzae]
MSHLLWRAYWQNDVDRFRRLLAPSGHTNHATSHRASLGGGAGGGSGGAGSPNALGTSPRTVATPNKARKSSMPFGGPGGGASGIGKAEVNSRDYMGLTLLLRAASSASENALAFVRALLDHPAIDIYAQDPESGWNALHRALYYGNISVARMLLAKERRDITEGVYKAGGAAASISRIGQLIKTKDHEGNSPFDLFATTIGDADLEFTGTIPDSNDAGDSTEDGAGSDSEEYPAHQPTSGNAGLQDLTDGDELFSFGSNKNMSLGVGDESDRQYPERLHLRRPDHLLYRFYAQYLEKAGLEQTQFPKLEELPAMILTRPIIVHNVVLSKFHSAVITTDPVSNLYICGVGRGGRLGLSDDQRVRFTYVPVQGALADRKVTQVALGQDHTMAVTDKGELWTWGSNTYSQLGYALPPPAKKDEEPMSLAPKQVFGALKKEVVIGVSASAIHSVAHTTNSVFCWGKNSGQLALMDADSRSLEVQQTPRKVAASLFSAPIVMVSAIDKATTVLLANHIVCVFTNYGYNMVKFPEIDPFATYHISNPAVVLGYDAAASKGQRICHITSGGETIAAVTGRGDLFVMGLNHNADVSSSASTTNPAKIKGSVSQPQCIWRAWKDGVKSVGVGDHGSVIIATKSGAVWRRVKRATAKDAYAGVGAKRKDYKFQRVPYITRVVTVRSSPSGAFAAVRRDSSVMKQLGVGRQEIWEDLDALLPLRGLVALKPKFDNAMAAKLLPKRFSEDDSDTGRAIVAMLQSSDPNADLAHHLDSFTSNDLEGADIWISSSSCPDLKVPVHGWLMSARSPTIRAALAAYRSHGAHTIADCLAIEDMDGKACIQLESLELSTVLNLILFAYTDRIAPAWNIRQPSPSLTQASRQQRVELMKVAARLGIAPLEAAARLQNDPNRSLADDLGTAIKEPSFFDDGDILLELEGGEVAAHSSLLCQRCPYFEGLYNGRSAGMWLTGRRDDAAVAEPVKIDLKHFEREPFEYVLRYLYSDAGTELFDEAVAASFDDFTDLIMDVMAMANELMLDRLSEICQKVMGGFVTTRTIAHLLNEISPCSVTNFKEAGWNYICTQMETMLENHLLDDLEEDVLQELDEQVKVNQANHASKCDSEQRLLETYTDLATDIEEERMVRVKEMAYKASQKEDDRKLSASFKGRVGSLDDGTMTTSTPDKGKRKSTRNEPFSPSLRPKVSTADLMFAMDEDDDGVLSPGGKQQQQPSFSRSEDPSIVSTPRRPAAHRSSSSIHTPAGRVDITISPSPINASPLTKTGSPWQQKPLVTSNLDLRDIMSEDSMNTTSALSAGLAAQKQKEANVKAATANVSQPQKMSQKERKKHQQMQAALLAQEANQPNKTPWEAVPGQKDRGSPWKPTPATTKVSLKDVTAAEKHTPPASAAASMAKPFVAAESSPKPAQRRTASPDTRFAGQSRTPKGLEGRSPQPSSSPLVPHSKSYMKQHKNQKAEPTLGLSMADIIGQQRREQELVKEAVAKRSLQEIQQEQEFQSWWDQESQRIQEEERRRAALLAARDKGANGEGSSEGARGGRGRRGGRSGGKSRGGSAAAPAGGTSSPAEGPAVDQKGPGRRSRGRARGRGDSKKA